MGSSTKSPEGLSPRVRGNHGNAGVLQLPTRSIPAGAGEPQLHPRGIGWDAVYPRGCGGTILTGTMARSSPGLSPRVRGNLHGFGGAAQSYRSIPAGAGERGTNTPNNFAAKVYPRGCGGTIAKLLPIRATIGLSPRVRGNQRVL